ncbi:MAG TPA: DNA alkylation repair protein [Candidatus Sulfopaludibacter sp.]|nr:DNA alkylation repair protein [Candidatus Sulfopaludibacter sp.]
MTAAELIAILQSHANPDNVAGMARYGIRTDAAFGVPMPVLRSLAKQAGKDHALALDLWESGIHEARILATLVEELGRVTPRQMDRWARDFDSWDVCDQACHNLFRYTPRAFEKAAEWARDRREFVKRAGFSLMAGLAVKAKTASGAQFEAFLPLIAEAAGDDRNMVKKAVNWALRQIGKRNPRLRRKAMASAEKIRKQGTRSARWIASDALRELKIASDTIFPLKESRKTGNTNTKEPTL